jgi:hypothetical protein
MTIQTLLISGIPFTSYASVTEADNYLLPTSANAAWVLLTADQKKAALITATRQIDGFMFSGDKTSPTQPNKFPRTGSAYPSSTEVPIEIENAVITLAANPTVDIYASATSVTKKLKAGSVEVEYFFSNNDTGLKGEAKHIQILLSGFLANNNINGAGAFSNVSDIQSPFNDLWRGFFVREY